MRKALNTLLLTVMFSVVFAGVKFEKAHAFFSECASEPLCMFTDVFDYAANTWRTDTTTRNPGNVVSFNIGVKNNSTAPITNIVVKDSLPSIFNFNPAADVVIAGYNGPALDWSTLMTTGVNIGTLQPQTSVQIAVRAYIKEYYQPGTFTFTNTATVTADGGYNLQNSATVNVTFNMPVNSGLNADYYNNQDVYGTPSFSRIDPVVDSTNGALNWTLFGSPNPAITIDNFSVVWYGQVRADYNELYTFYTNSDDGIRVWIDNNLIIDKWMERGQPVVKDSANVNLTYGWHNIRIEYFERAGGSIAQLFWSSASQTGGVEQIVPQYNLRQNYNGFIPGGLAGEYFDNDEMVGDPVAVRTDKGIDFMWGNGAPIDGLPTDNFSIRWTGRILANNNETYTFCTFADDGTRLWIDNNIIIEDWNKSGFHQTCGSIVLTAGWHNIRMDYFDFKIDAGVRLAWSAPAQTGGVIVPIPADHMDDQYSGNVEIGLVAEYFDNIELIVPAVFTTVSGNVDFDWYIGSPDPMVPSNYFSARFSGEVYAATAGGYKFVTFADDGVRVYVDGNLVIDNWNDQSYTRTESPVLNLTAGWHDIVVEYYEYEETAAVRLFWTTPDNATERAIPISSFRH